MTIFSAESFLPKKRADALHLLKQLEQVSSNDPRRWHFVHLARSTPPSLSCEGHTLYDDGISHCFAGCKTHLIGGVEAGICRLSLHSPAAYITSVIACDYSSPHSKDLLHSFDLLNGSVLTSENL